MPIRPDIDSKDIIRLYFDEGLSGIEIGKRFGCSHESIYRRLEKLGLNRRSIKEARQLYCQSHDMPRGEHTSNWKGGRVKYGKEVYVYDPTRTKEEGETRYIAEHRVIWEKVHNKRLPRGWVIHHLNGIHDDNRPCNLVAMPKSKHSHYIPALRTRIRELEAEISVLRKALEINQSIFYLSEN